jgi:hypothetical protein
VLPFIKALGCGFDGDFQFVVAGFGEALQNFTIIRVDTLIAHGGFDSIEMPQT